MKCGLQKVTFAEVSKLGKPFAASKVVVCTCTTIFAPQRGSVETKVLVWVVRVSDAPPPPVLARQAQRQVPPWVPHRQPDEVDVSFPYNG